MSANLEITYVANVRLPTEKAHGLQIMQMCAGLSRVVSEVRLVAPKRSVNPTAERFGHDPFEYFGIPETFDLRLLSNVDVFALQRVLGPLFPVAFLGHEILWGLYAMLGVRRTRPDVAYTRQESLLYWLVRADVPTIYEAHAVPQGVRRHLLRSTLHRKACLGAVAVTESIGTELRDLGEANVQVVVEPDAVNLDLFADLPGMAEARSRLDLPRDRHIVGYVGGFQTMADDKGIGSLIEAIARLSTDGVHNIMFVCVGGDEEAARAYRALARSHGLDEQAVRFIGRVPHPDIPLWLRAFDIASMPMPATPHFSHNMSPMKMFEYMAAQVPIVATDLPATREILEDGVTACLVAPTVEGLADGIARVIEDPLRWKSVARRARRRVTQHTWQARARRILGALVPDWREP